MPKKIFRRALLAATFIGLATPTPVLAQAAWEFTTAGNSFTNGSWNFSNSFTVVNQVTVSGLGWYADPLTGMSMQIR